MKRKMIDGTTDTDIGKDVAINNVAILQGFRTANGGQAGEIQIRGTDNFVSHNDQKNICKNLNSSNKYYVSFDDKDHFGTLFKRDLTDDRIAQAVIKRFLKDNTIPQDIAYEIISSQGDCE